MKTLQVLTLCAVAAMISPSALAQKMSIYKTKELEVESRKAHVAGFENIRLFILTQDSVKWAEGLMSMKKCHEGFNNLIKNGTFVNGMGDLYKSIYEGEVNMVTSDYNSYVADYFFKKVKKEKDADRDKSFKFNGTTYKVSKDDKRELDHIQDMLKSHTGMVETAEKDLNSLKKAGIQ